MSWHTPHRNILATALIALSVITFLRFGSVDRVEPTRGADQPIGPIYAGHTAAQTFRATPGSLVGIEVRLGTYARRNAGIVAFTLRPDPPASELRTVDVAASSVADNALYAFRFEPVDLSEATVLSFTISSTAEDGANAITAWTTSRAAGVSEGAAYDGALQASDLVYTPIYREPLGLALSHQVGPALDERLAPLISVAVMFLPGLALSTLLISREAGFGQRLAAAPAFGIAAVAISVLFASVAGRLVTPIGAWTLLGIAGFVLVVTLRQERRQPSASGGRRDGWPPLDWGLLAALGVTLAGVAMRAVIFDTAVLPPGADSYQHVLITQLIMDQAGIPPSYVPYAPITSFSYHFGFHALAALTALTAGVSALDAVRIVAPLVIAASALSVFFLARAARLGDAAAVTAALIVALISPFPGGLLAVGRYPEAAGMVVLPVAVGFLLRAVRPEYCVDPGARSRVITGVGVLAAGLFLTHYRVAIYLAFIGVLVLVAQCWQVWTMGRRSKHTVGVPSPTPMPDRGPEDRSPKQRLMATARVVRTRAGDYRLKPVGEVVLPLIGSGLVTLALVAPWLARLMQSFTLGLGGSGGRYGPEYYSIARLGAVPEPAAALTLATGLLGALLALRNRQRLVLLLTVWAAAQLALSNPYWLPVSFAGQVDLVTVVSSLFFPLSVAIGYLVAEAARALGRWRPQASGPLVGVALACAATWGLFEMPAIRGDDNDLATAADLSAAGWLEAHTSPDARVLVEAAVRHWQPDYVVPTDAGYWLPLLASRRITLLPILYPGERGVEMTLIENIERLAASEGGDLGAPAAVGLLHSAGVTHVFIGARGGPINEQSLRNSRAYRLLYAAGGAAIYELEPEAGL